MHPQNNLFTLTDSGAAVDYGPKTTYYTHQNNLFTLTDSGAAVDYGH